MHLNQLVLLLVLLGVSQCAQISFIFDSSDDGQAVVSKTVSGITLTLSNPDSSNGKFFIDSDGVVFFNGEDNTWSPTQHSFNMTFSQSVRLLSYVVTYNDGPGTSCSFTMEISGGSSSTNNLLKPTGSYSFSGQPIASANANIFVNATFVGELWAQINNITVDTGDVTTGGVASTGSRSKISTTGHLVTTGTTGAYLRRQACLFAATCMTQQTVVGTAINSDTTNHHLACSIPYTGTVERILSCASQLSIHGGYSSSTFYNFTTAIDGVSALEFTCTPSGAQMSYLNGPSLVQWSSVLGYTAGTFVDHKEIMSSPGGGLLCKVWLTTAELDV